MWRTHHRRPARCAHCGFLQRYQWPARAAPPGASVSQERRRHIPSGVRHVEEVERAVGWPRNAPKTRRSMRRRRSAAQREGREPPAWPPAGLGGSGACLLCPFSSMSPAGDAAHRAILQRDDIIGDAGMIAIASRCAGVDRRN